MALPVRVTVPVPLNWSEVVGLNSISVSPMVALFPMLITPMELPGLSAPLQTSVPWIEPEPWRLAPGLTTRFPVNIPLTATVVPEAITRLLCVIDPFMFTNLAIEAVSTSGAAAKRDVFVSKIITPVPEMV